MAKNSIATSEAGIAHLGMILLVLVVLGATAFSAFRVIDSKNNKVADSESTSQVDSSDDSGDSDNESDDENKATNEANGDVEAENATE